MIRKGIYEHYKGNKYRVLYIAKDSETLDLMVVYQALYGDGGIWVRPLSMFTEKIYVNDTLVERFKYIGEWLNDNQ